MIKIIVIVHRNHLLGVELSAIEGQILAFHSGDENGSSVRVSHHRCGFEDFAKASVSGELLPIDAKAMAVPEHSISRVRSQRVWEAAEHLSVLFGIVNKPAQRN